MNIFKGSNAGPTTFDLDWESITSISTSNISSLERSRSRSRNPVRSKRSLSCSFQLLSNSFSCRLLTSSQFCSNWDLGDLWAFWIYFALPRVFTMEAACDLEGGNRPCKIQLQVLVFCREDATLSQISLNSVPVSEMISSKAY